MEPMDTSDSDSTGTSWEQWDRAANDQYNRVKAPRSKETVLKILVMEGRRIKRDSILNLVDIPNPQIRIECPAAKGPKRFHTSSKVNNANPVWNEAFAFVLPPDNANNQTEKNVRLQFTLIVEDWHTPHDPIAEAEFDPSVLRIGEVVQETVSFERHGSITVKIEKNLAEAPDLRLSFSLCEEEMNFRAKRMPNIMTALEEMLGPDEAPKSPFETPVMSLLGSGGGLRAMVGMCGFIEGLNEIGLLDCLMYAFGTSGSSWYLTGSYARKALHGVPRKQYHKWLRKSFHTASFWELVKISNIRKCRKLQHEKLRFGQPFSLVDYYGICVANKVIGKRYASGTLSDLRPYVQTAEVPFPVLNTVQAHDTVDVWKYHADCNLSPFECELPNYGINIDTALLNSEYYNGILMRKLPEPRLSFTVGALGSAFALRLNRIFGIDHYEDEDILENATNPGFFAPKEEASQGSHWRSLMKWLNNLPQFLDRNFLINRSAQILNVVRGFTDIPRFALNPVEDQPAEDSDDIGVDGLSESEEILSLIDGGILCNVPIGAALRPQRRNEILFVADFTAYDADVSHETLEAAVKLARAGRYKFPPVDLEKIKRQRTRELYIFEDENDPDCPIVFWFMTSTRKFRKEKDYEPRNKNVVRQLEDGQRFTDFRVFASDNYVTTQTVYTDVDFERLKELMRYNVKIHAEEIKEKIRRKIMHKRLQWEKQQ